MTENDEFDGPNAPFDDEHEFKESPGFIEAWKSSPLLKILTLGAGLVVVIGLIVMFGGDDEVSQSRLRPAATVNEAPGAEVDEQYEQAIQAADQQRFEEAVRNQSSVLPTPRGSLKSRLGDDANQGGSAEEEDPLAQWRRRAEEREREREQARTQQQQATIVQRRREQQQQANTPNQDNISNMTQAMTAQMQSILQTRNLQGAKSVAITSPTFFDDNMIGANRRQDVSGNALQGGGQGDGSPSVREETIIIPAGEIFYGQLITEANSDVNGPVLARVYQGPLRGARMLGEFRTTQADLLILEFDTIIIDGIDFSVDAVAVDPKTTSPGLATDIDRHLLTRVILPGAAAFVEGLGRAYAERENTVTVAGDTVIEQTPDLNTTGKIATGVAEAASELGEVFEDEAERRDEPTITVAAGTPIGILFVEAVTE